MQSEMAKDTVAGPGHAEKSPLKLLRESKASVEGIVERMLSIKKEGNPKPENRELLTQMFLKFINLRQVNRAILMEEEKVKAETELAKSEVDLRTLQLHNLMYEKSHYFKTTKACRDFNSRYPSIDLLSEQDVLRDAPESIICQTLSNDTSHDLMLKRLNIELHQRKELCKLQARLEQHKKCLLETNEERKKFLSSLPVHLKSLKKAWSPVQNQLSLQNTKKLKHHNLAELLPPPLYVIYSQFMVQKEAFKENIDLEVSGSPTDSHTYARQQAEKNLGMFKNTESSRLEDDGKTQKKRHKNEAELYQVHPLIVVLHVYDDVKSHKLVTLKFEYLLMLNVVCVGSENGLEKNLLCNLFPDDAGLEPPHQSAKLILGDGHAFDESRTSRPYKWAQRLAGIVILHEMLPLLIDQSSRNSDTAKGYASAADQHNVQTVLQRIRESRRVS